MNKSDTNYLEFLKQELSKADAEVCECNKKEVALNDQITMIQNTRDNARSNCISLKTEIKAMEIIKGEQET